MALKPCIVCREPANGARCERHRQPDRRPTRHQRGYDTSHDRRTAHLRRQAETNRTPCRLCGQPIDYRLLAPNPAAFSAHHLTRDKQHGPLVPTHAACNTAAGKPIH